MEKFTETPVRYTTACRVCKNRSSDLCVGDFDLKNFDPDFKIPFYLIPKLMMDDYRELPGRVKGELLAFYLIKLMEVLDGCDRDPDRP